MKRTKFKKLLVVLSIVTSIISTTVTAIPTIAAPASTSSKTASRLKATQSSDIEKMEVHFIDVGQGDSTLIMCGDQSMLIDTGDDSKGTTIQNYIQKRNIKKLDYLVLTHPDSDHIGGAPVIITKFDIDKVFMSNFEKDNKTYQKLIQALDNKRLKYITPDVGSQYSLGSATITILAPNKEYDDPNNASVALLIQNGDNKFLFTGDAQEEAELDILDNKIDISADVYKVGHHGSKTSTCEEFFEAVDPKYAVISCGEENSYGHPHAQTLNTFRINGVEVYRTDESGSIIATSDGKEITFSVPASETWKAGEPTKSSAANENEKNKSSSSGTITKEETQASEPVGKELTYVLNTKTKKFHKPSCGYLPTKNRKDSTDSRDAIIAKGYDPCKKCNP